jgi:Holliday junction DNA helicase RuvA
MIVTLTGTVSAISGDALVLEVGGVGYRVYAGPRTLSQARVGAHQHLHTHHLVREDLQALYGFRSAEELAFFELLMTVTGVGPKVALAIVSSRAVPDLQLAILQGDEAVLTAVSGVGKRLGARIILELKEKVAAAGLAGGVAAAAESGATPAATTQSEVVAALVALGYAPQEAREAARDGVLASAPGASLEDRVKAALRTLRRE